MHRSDAWFKQFLLNACRSEAFSIMHVLLVQTIQVYAFRTLLDALKEIITEANIHFDQDGIRIKTMDISHTVLVHLKLEARNFEKYEYTKPITIGVNMMHFYMLIKSITSSDLLTLYVDDDNKNVLGIQIENSSKKSIKNITMNLLDLNEKGFQIPKKTFDFIVNMPSVEFQKICRDMNMITNILDIKAINDSLYFKGKGDFATQEFTIGEQDGRLRFIKGTDSNTIVQGIFLLKHLITFTRCTNLSDTIDI